MRNCPYCQQGFSTKQRLVSHLTKTKKCYDVDRVGVPPVLFELMGFEGNDVGKLKDVILSAADSQEKGKSNKENKENKENEDDDDNNGLPAIKINQQESNIISQESMKQFNQMGPMEQLKHLNRLSQMNVLGDAGKIAPDALTNMEATMGTLTNESKTNRFQCENCLRFFVSQRNMEKHKEMMKCPKARKLREANTFMTAEELDEQQKQIKATRMAEHNGVHKVSQSNMDAYRPKPRHGKKYEILERSSISKSTIEVPKYQSIIGGTPQTSIKYIVKEDLVDYLVKICGSKENAVKFIKSCIQGKLRGDANFLYRVYFDGRDSKDYPVDVLDAKGKKLYYKTPENIISDDNGAHIKPILIENLRNCYLKFSNYMIDSNLHLENKDALLGDYDLFDMQKRLVELSDEKVRDKVFYALLEMVRNKGGEKKET